MKTIKLIFLFGLTAMMAWSCSNPTSSNNGDFASVPYANATRVPIGGNNSAKADSSNQLAKKIPGFGGMFINQSGQFSIYLMHPAKQKAKAKEVLSNSETITKALARLRAEGEKYQSVSVSNMKVKESQYTFTQLYSWRKNAAVKAFAIDGVYSDGIDQSTNKITVGVKNKDVRVKVRNKLAELNIPVEAVAIYKMSKPENYGFPIGH